MLSDKAEAIGRTTFLYVGKEVEVIIYRPVKKWTGNEFTCKFSICGSQIHHISENIGYDSMQSLILALCSIGHYLRESVDIDKTLIEWPGGEMKFPDFNLLK